MGNRRRLIRNFEDAVEESHSRYHVFDGLGLGELRGLVKTRGILPQDVSRKTRLASVFVIRIFPAQ